MQLHELKGFKKRKPQRVGRGGKRGTTSGRGQKGQKSRSGHRIRPAARDLLIRIPKRRGFRNKPKSDKPVIIDLTTLAKAVKLHKAPMSVIDLAALRAMGLVSVRYRGEVKILGDGDISMKVTLRGVKASASAKAKIEKAGGAVGL